MKLGQLTIHNIASIEDAFINFEAQPLADSEVFLITGKTGAGKSTVLDAICLALYADTPRLDNTKIQGNILDGDKEVKVSDPRQLMRRNTGEAFVRLSFTGSNDIPYEALWACTRARKKHTGNFQPKIWQLIDLNTQTTLTKDEDIKDEIKKAVGLDFNQFCRTTLLAQGEFTRFLNSKDDEKAEILEKITGVDIYTKIGAKIYEITKQKEQLLNEIKLQTQNINILSTDEKNSKTQLINSLENEYKNLKTNIDKQKEIIHLFERKQLLKQEKNKAQQELDNTLTTIQSDAFKTTEHTVKLWQETTEIRQLLTEINTLNNTSDILLTKLGGLKNKYIELLQNINNKNLQIKAKEKQLADCQNHILSEQTHANTYSQVQTITGLVSNIAADNSIISQQQTVINRQQIIRLSLTDKYNNTNKLLEQTGRTLDLLDDKLKKAESDLDEMQLPQTREELNLLQNRLQYANIAKIQIETLSQNILKAKQEQQKLVQQKETIDGLLQQLHSLTKQKDTALIAYNTIKELYDKQKDTVNGFATTIRAGLTIGDTCPVCLQQITNHIPLETEIQQLVSQTENSFLQAENQYNSLCNKYNEINAEIKTSVAKYEKDKYIQDNDTSVSVSRQKALEACNRINIKDIDENTEAEIGLIITQLTEDISRLTKQLNIAQEKETEIRQLHKLIEQQRLLIEQHTQLLYNTQKEIDATDNQIQTAQTLIKNRTDNISENLNKLHLTLTPDWWELYQHNSPDFFIKKLSTDAGQYNNALETAQNLTYSIQTASKEIHDIEQNAGLILLQQPEWEKYETTSIPTHQTTDLLLLSSTLYSDVSIAVTQLKDTQLKLSSYRTQVDEYLSQNPSLTVAALLKLNTYSSELIDEKLNAINKERQKLTEKQAVLLERDKQLKELLTSIKDINGQYSAESLSLNINNLEQQLRVVEQQRGALFSELNTDDNNRKRLGELITEQEKRDIEHNSWDRLCKMIGDQTGKKFRTIAQSYILANLIQAANHYLATLTDRYTLYVSPGTFVIYLEDSYQGYTKRAATTISGGESFLVSLSLALALSDIGSHLAVDTLFIDEGFGTLSGEPLQKAINTLKTLRKKENRKVGIISHVEELRERIPVQIQVIQEGHSSSSKVRVVSL